MKERHKAKYLNNIYNTCHLLLRMGAGSMNYKEMAQQVELATGGLSVSTHVCSHHTEPNTFEQV